VIGCRLARDLVADIGVLCIRLGYIACFTENTKRNVDVHGAGKNVRKVIAPAISEKGERFVATFISKLRF